MRTPVGDAFGVDQVDLGETAPCLDASVSLAPGELARARRPQTLTATVKERGEAAAGRTVTFTVVSGPSAGVVARPLRPAPDGVASAGYTGVGPGADVVEASLTAADAVVRRSNRVNVTWTAPPPPPPPPPTVIAAAKDTDRDGLPDTSDNCPDVANRDQADADRTRSVTRATSCRPATRRSSRAPPRR